MVPTLMNRRKVVRLMLTYMTGRRLNWLLATLDSSGPRLFPSELPTWLIRGRMLPAQTSDSILVVLVLPLTVMRQWGDLGT